MTHITALLAPSLRRFLGGAAPVLLLPVAKAAPALLAFHLKRVREAIR